MRQSIGFAHNGRALEARALVIASDWQIWIYENGERIYLYDVLPHEDTAQNFENILQAAMAQAKLDIEEARIIVPVVRTLVL